MMKTLRDIEHLEGVKVLVRVDFNVPIRSGMIVDDMRIRSALPTIDYLRSKGAKVILMSHLEASDGSNATLEPVSRYLDKLGVPVWFVRNLSDAYEMAESGIKNGECLLLENLRQHEGEKLNDKKFAKELASLADIYVNDAFSVSHREHASVVGVPTFMPGYAGIQLEKEILNISKAFDPDRPFLFMLGGAKFETKLPLLAKFMDIADMVFVGGALANDLFKAKGYETGASMLSKGDLDLSSIATSPKLLLPIDVTTKDGQIKKPSGLTADDKVLDAGPATVEMLKEKMRTAALILWNGPLGLYEEGFKQPTQDLARAMGESSQRGASTIVGGGDTLAAITELGIEDQFTFVSTGGGAMLDYLAKGTLPGIVALEKSGR